MHGFDRKFIYEIPTILFHSFVCFRRFWRLGPRGGKGQGSHKAHCLLLLWSVSRQHQGHGQENLRFRRMLLL